MILVAGATGTLGGRIARGLVETGKHLRILVRDPSSSTEMAAVGMATSAESLITAGAQAVTGDLTDRASLGAACAGIDTVITTATATKRSGDLEAVDLNGARSLIAAAVLMAWGGRCGRQGFGASAARQLRADGQRSALAAHPRQRHVVRLGEL